MDVKKTLSECELFEGLSEEFIDEIVPLCEQVYVKTGDTVISKGDTEYDVYIVSKGRISLEIDLSDRAVSEKLDQAVVSKIFGEMPLIDEYKRSANAVALEDSDLLRLSRNDLLDLIQADTNIGCIVMTNLAKILARKLLATNIRLQEVLST